MERVEKILAVIERESLSAGLSLSITVYTPAGPFVEQVRDLCLKNHEIIGDLPDTVVVIRVMQAIAIHRPFRPSSGGGSAILNIRAWLFACLFTARENFGERRRSCPTKGNYCDEGMRCMSQAARSLIEKQPALKDEAKADEELSLIANWSRENYEGLFRSLTSTPRYCKEFERLRLVPR